VTSLKGKKIIEVTEYAAKIGKPAPVVLNAAKRQTIPAFREKGYGKSVLNKNRFIIQTK